MWCDVVCDVSSLDKNTIIIIIIVIIIIIIIISYK